MKKAVILILVFALLLSLVRLFPYIDRYGAFKVIDQYKSYFASVVYGVINHIDEVRDAFYDGFNTNTFSAIFRLITTDLISVLAVPIIVLFVPDYVILHSHNYTDSDGLHHMGGGIR